jgi:apolipoprotein N-acyltransferase
VTGVDWRLGTRLLVAAGSGGVLALAFPPYDWWWLLPLAVAGLTLACAGTTGRRGALVGFVAGLVFFAALLRWLQVVGPDAWLALTLLQAAFWALLGGGLAVVSRLPGWPAWAAGCWVLVESLRSAVPWGGFPWGRLAHAMVDSPVVGWVHLGGTSLLTAASAALGVLLAGAVSAVVSGQRRRAVGAVALTAAVVAVGLGAVAVVQPPAPVGEADVAIVQGNVPRAGLDFFGQREAVLRNHVEATLGLADDVAAGRVPQPDVVLWPENSSDIDPLADAEAAALVSRTVSAVGAPVLVGAMVGVSPQEVENTAIVWDPVSGPGETYVKRHPVPFGEYIPGRALLEPLIGRLALVPRDMRPGTEPGVLEVGPVTLGVVICFEIAYDREVRDVVVGGGEVLVVQTNNATYGRTGQPEQQFQISRLRALEHGREVLVAATSGISGVIAADGRVVAQTEEFTQQVLPTTVPLRTGLTWATRVGGWVAAGLALLGAAGIVLGVVAGRRVTAVQPQRHEPVQAA